MAIKAVLAAVFLGLLTCVAGMVVISAGDFPAPTNECAKGPSFWCSNIMNAKSCRATKHCIQTVWERQAVPEDNDSVCEICKEMVQEARDQLMSNETQDDLRAVFEGSCNLMPIKLVRLNCIKLVDDFIPELIEMLASQMNPTVVCTTALLCNNAWTDSLQAEYKAARLATVESNQSNCGTCRNFMSNNLKKVQRSDPDDIQVVLFNVCDKFNSYSDACKFLVATNIDAIRSYLEVNLKNDPCKPLGFCKEESKAMRVSVEPKSNDRKFQAKFDTLESKFGDDLECEFCEALITNLRQIIVTNTTRAEFVQVLKGICQQTGPYSQECESLVDQYGNIVYMFLLHEMDPHKACKILTLCPQGLGKFGTKSSLSYMKIQPTDVLTATKIVPAKKIVDKEAADKISNDLLIGQEEAKALNAALPIERLLPGSLDLNAPKKPTCILCEYVLQQIITDLHNSTVQKEVEDVIKNVCHKLPSSIKDECTKLVDTYGDALFFLLSQELDPSIACASLELCPSAEEIKLPANPFRAKIDDPNTCALCEFVITTLDKKLKDNRTEESIKAAMESVCPYMPKSIRQDCTKLVDAYADEIIEMLIAQLSPEEVCAALKLCSPKGAEKMPSSNDDDDRSGLTLGEFLRKMKSKAPAKPITVGEFVSQIKKADARGKPTISNNPACVMCEFAMSALEKQLINNHTEENMKRTIDFLCAHLPDTVADMCIDFVEQYGDEIFQLVMSQVAPKAICSQLGLCSPVSSRKLIGHKGEHSEETHLLGRKNEHLELSWNKCDICETVVEYLDKLLMDDTIEESIDHIIERACVIVPRGVKDKCTEMVETYGPYLISQLGELMDKTKVCRSLHLCKPPAGHVQLLGGKQCTWGPTYWCQSTQHADACNALEHCQAKVWMKSAP